MKHTATKPELPQDVLDLLVRNTAIDEEEITRDARLGDDLGCDSLDLVELVIALEEHYGIGLSPDEEDSLTGETTVGQLVNLFEMRVDLAQARGVARGA